MRYIDKKFHIKSGQIFKTSNGEIVPEDEPLFLFRARDHLAILGLQAYRALCIEDNCTEYHLKMLDEQIQIFQAFANMHPKRMKQPGCTLGK